MVAGQEVARMVAEFESLQTHTHADDHKHHEQYSGIQIKSNL